MKKIFLGLLALVGMVAGFTLTSCGGGGGSDDVIDISGLRLTSSGTTPLVVISFDSRIGRGNAYFCSMTFGNENPSGTFSVSPGYPRLNSDNKVQINGILGIDDSSFTTGSNNFALFVGIRTNPRYGVSLTQPLSFEMTIDKATGVTSYRLQTEGSGHNEQGNVLELVEPVDKTLPNGFTAENYLRIFNMLGNK